MKKTIDILNTFIFAAATLAIGGLIYEAFSLQYFSVVTVLIIYHGPLVHSVRCVYYQIRIEDRFSGYNTGSLVFLYLVLLWDPDIKEAAEKII